MCHNISRPTTCGLCRSKSPTFAVCASPSCALLFCKAYNAQSPTLVYLGEKFNWKDSLSFSLSLSWTLSSAAVIVLGGGNDITYSKTNIPHDRTNMFKFFALPVFTSRSHVSCKASHRPLIKKQTNNYKNRPIFGKNHNFSASDPKACFTCEQCVCVCVRASARAHARAVIVSRSSRKWNLKTSCYGRS